MSRGMFGLFSKEYQHPPSEHSLQLRALGRRIGASQSDAGELAVCVVVGEDARTLGKSPKAISRLTGLPAVERDTPYSYAMRRAVLEDLYWLHGPPRYDDARPAVAADFGL